MDPASPSSRLSRLLAPHERLLWSGRPKQGLLFRAADAFVIPFSLMFCGFAVVFEVVAFGATASWFARLWGIPFVLMGLYIVFGRFAVDVLQRRRTAYGVTSERVIIVSGVLRESLESLPLRGLSQIRLTVRPDGSGDIAFGPRNPFEGFLVPGWPGAGRFHAATFEAIPGARGVHDLIGRARAGTA